jgi:hypothetical protein
LNYPERYAWGSFYFVRSGFDVFSKKQRIGKLERLIGNLNAIILLNFKTL